jgi:hypothetical protein
VTDSALYKQLEQRLAELEAQLNAEKVRALVHQCGWVWVGVGGWVGG